MGRTIAALTLLLLACAAAAQDPPPLKGTLCFIVKGKGAVECRATEGDVARVEAAQTERAFIWSRGDGKVVRASVVPPGATEVKLTADDLLPVSVSVRGDRRAGWPLDLRILIVDLAERGWAWVVPAKSVETLSEIFLAPGRYTIGFSAAHHLGERRGVRLERKTTLKQVELRPIPMISGRVVSSDDKPLADARLLLEDGKLLTTTNEQGNFRVEAGDPPPDSMIVEKAGFGSMVLALKLTAPVVDLGVIRLGTALKLTLKIVKPESVRGDLTVSLLRENDFKYDYTPVGTKQLPAAENTIVFENLSKGDYYAVVSGKAATEKLAVAIVCDAEDVESEIRIEPYRLDGTAHLGEEPLNGSISISSVTVGKNFMHAMPVTFPVENGRFGGTVWQHGQLSGFLNLTAPKTGQPIESPLLGADPSAWDVRIPRRFITGRVYDSDTNQPLARTPVSMIVASADDAGSPRRLYTTINAGDDGTFSVLAASAGTYELKVNVPGFVAAKHTIEIRPTDGSVQRDFAMTRGVETVVEFVWPSGAPVANARVSEGIASDGHNAERLYNSDATGRVPIRSRKGEVRTLYVTPREGSFGIAHVTGGATEPVRVVVPPPVGSLRVRLVMPGKKFVPAGVAMRFNGEAVPEPVLFAIAQRSAQTSTERTFVQMPAGAYEVWPVSRTFAASGPVRSVGVSSGDAEVELTVTPAP